VSARVLEVLGYSNRGGAARSVVELAQRLPEHGFEVTVAAPHDPALVAVLAETGTRFVPVAMTGRSDWRSFARLHGLLRRERFDVVHTHCRNADLHGGLSARAAGVPLVAHLRGLLVDGEGRLGSGLVDRVHRAFLARVPDRIIAISDAVRARALQELRSPPDRIVTVLNGVDLEDFSAEARMPLRRELALPGGVFLVVSIGTFGRCKGQDVLLRALALLPGRVHAAFAGEGESGAFESLARELGVAARVRFLGPRDDVPALLAACDALVQPSRWEGFGRSAAEAMAAGRPVVASAVGGLEEIVQDGKTGLLVAPDRPELLAAAIARLANEPPLARRLARAAAGFARERLDAWRVAREVAEVLRAAAGIPLDRLAEVAS